ncbi:phosphoglycerate dehydrogenase [Vulgatibacter incomptus]|uniref:D-3-phosphoglycerate dehydrogenase n=1 Tax=Vulgatibacter incomptus TaxID=1391653 RepID=A0A0K1P9U0_9BACT|nr:phosphoglycerate dehydrogenase [Vulgatibacter incomptus]AKU89879.1 D-3-phosphoglycerate dehydrogenase [Vulgatibacter incomptus]
MAAKVLVSDDLSREGIEILERGGLSVDVKVGLKPEELRAIIGEYDGLAVRSATKVTADLLAAAGKLKVVGRAGVGVDNVDLPAATKRGVIVMNTPGGSSVTVAEQTFAMMLSMFRHVPAATASVKQGKWEKKKFQGREAAGKTLGVIGIGNIGAIVVERARAFGMKVIAHDPFISPEAAAKLGATLVPLEEIWSSSDVISLHVPLTEQTRHIVNAQTLAKMKPGSYLVNAARGGVVDEVALADALKSGHLAGAALDVFEKEPPAADHPLFALDNFVCAPHLGASTQEAQEIVAVQLAEQMVAFFQDGSIKNAVNVPAVSKELLEHLGPWLDLAGRVGAVAGQLAPENASKVTIELTGEVTEHGTKPLTNEILRGLLPFFTQDPVNVVNAPALAKERGLAITEVKKAESPDYASTIGIKLEGASGSIEVVGSVLGKHDLRITRIDRFEIDAVPDGYILVLRNEDVPKIVGKVGSILGDAGVNIGRIHLSRSARSGQAFSMINIDSPASAAVLAELRAVPHVISVTPIQL